MYYMDELIVTKKQQIVRIIVSIIIILFMYLELRGILYN